jgi:type I restriction enzyme S subunit
MKSKVNKIPEDWKIVKLEEVILDIGDGGTPSTKIKEYFSGGIPWVNVEDIKRDIYDTRRHLSESGLKNSSAKLWPEGTIIFSFGASIGKVGIARVKLCTKQGIAGIVPNSNKIDSEFLYYVLVRESEKIKKIGQSMGSTIREVRPSKLVKLIIFGLPQLPEQKAIANILSTVDLAIQKVDEIIAKTERLKKGLMQKLLTKGIGHKEFKDSEIGRIPKEWEVVKMGDIGNFQYGLTVSAINKETEIKLLRITDITGYGINWESMPYCEITEEVFRKYSLKPGDVLFARIGATTGKTCLIDRSDIKAIFGSYLIRFLPTIKIDTQFLYQYTQSLGYWNQVNRIKEGQLKKGLNTKTLASLLLPFPPLPEQQKIAEILFTVDKKLELERKRKEKLERIKKGLMNDLLTGRKRITEKKD